MKNMTICAVVRLLVCFVALIIMSGCATVDFVTGREVSNLYSVNDDIKFGEDIYKEMMAGMQKERCPMDNDPKKVRELKEMMQRISSVSHLPDLPYSVTLMHTNIVNAFALPGGKVVVFEGLYDPKKGLVRDEQELAAVVAHEVAHVVCRHSTEQMTRNLPYELLLLGAAIYAEAKDDDELKTILGGAFLVYNGIIVTKYSRKDEREADRIGLEYMARAGYDPAAAVRLWKRVDKEMGSEPGVLNLLSTHPTSKDRYMDLEKQLPAALEIYARTRSGHPEAAPRRVDATDETQSVNSVR
jgi:predicted Zn-dependent protease